MNTTGVFGGLWRVAGAMAARAALVALLALGAQSLSAWAQGAAPPAAAPAAGGTGRVVVAGVVPDEATRSAILQKAREVYGADRVVDQLGIGPLNAPPNWAQHVVRAIQPGLRRVQGGSLSFRGNVVELAGSVDSEATRVALPQELLTQIGNPTYMLQNQLRAGPREQAAIDAAVANRIIEFEPGAAVLTPAGLRILDELVPVLKQFPNRRFEIVGHTDSDGGRAQNILLSANRAQAVKDHLVRQGIPAQQLATSGAGPDRPVADNATPDGRARNRRIEFRVLA